MKKFSQLLDQLSFTPSRNGKVALMVAYFKSTPDPDRGFALAALTNEMQFSIPVRKTIAQLATRHVSAELFKISRDYVGDSAETLALIWPNHREQADLSLAVVFAQVSSVSRAMAATEVFSESFRNIQIKEREIKPWQIQFY